MGTRYLIFQNHLSFYPNLEIEIHDFTSSSHSWTSHKIIAEPKGATHILRKPHKYEYKANSKNSISRFWLYLSNAILSFFSYNFI